MTANPQATAAPYRPSPLALGLHRGRLELLEFSRQRESVVFSFLFPVLLLAIFGAVLSYPIGGGLTFTQYFVPGIVAAGLFGVCFQTLAIQIPIERDKGTLKRLRGTPMPRSAYFLGKVVMVLVVGVAEIAVLLAVGVLFYDVNLPTTVAKWVTFGWVVALGAAACTLLGIAFSSVARTARSAPAVVTPIALVLQFISGVYFQFTSLPGWMQQVGAVFPLKWMAQGLRSVFLPGEFGTQEPAGSYELGRVALVLAAWAVAGLVLCVLTFRWTARKDG